MFPFSLCLERKRKPKPQQPNEHDQKGSFDAAEASPVTSSGDSGSTKVTCEVEPKNLHNFDSTLGTPTSLKSSEKRSYSSSVKSCSRSFTFSQLCQSPSSAEPAQIINEGHRLSGNFRWPTPPLKTRASPGTLNPQIKPMDFDQKRSHTIPEENEEPCHELNGALLSVRPRSYSDDPFAPPTPLGATYTSSQHRFSVAESDATGGSALNTQSPRKDLNEARQDPPALIPTSEPQLLTIARISKLSFDWILELPKTPAPHHRARFPSTSKSILLASSMSNYRTPIGTNVMNTPQSPNFSHTHSPSRTGDTNEVPFPQYP